MLWVPMDRENRAIINNLTISATPLGGPAKQPQDIRAGGPRPGFSGLREDTKRTRWPLENCGCFWED